MNATSSLQAFHMPGQLGDLFALYYSPLTESGPEHTILLVAPFGEEMNKVRQMVALQARRFAEQGYAVLSVDPFGTGDSEGDFADAQWQVWYADLQNSIDWLQQRGSKKITLWGVRSGVALVAELLQRSGQTFAGVILWQPIVDGKQFVTQFLRLRVAADVVGSAAGLTTKELRAQLDAGEVIEVAGYALSAALVSPLERFAFAQYYPAFARVPVVHWIEIVASEQRSIALPSKKVIEESIEQKVNIQLHKVVGEAFWATPELAQVPALLTLTTQLLA